MLDRVIVEGTGQTVAKAWRWNRCLPGEEEKRCRRGDSEVDNLSESSFRGQLKYRLDHDQAVACLFDMNLHLDLNKVVPRISRRSPRWAEWLGLAFASRSEGRFGPFHMSQRDTSASEPRM